MAVLDVSDKRISSFVLRDLEKALSTLPQQGSDVYFNPAKVKQALAPPTPGQPIPPPTYISDTQPMVIKDDIMDPPPILPQEGENIYFNPAKSKDVIITPPPMADKPSLLLPMLVAGAILLIQ